MPEVASAYVSLIPSARGFASAVTKETDSAAKSAGKRFGGVFSGSLKGVIGGALAGIGVTKLISDSLGEAREAQKVTAQTAQVIKTTGGVANVTADQVGKLATSISNKVGIDDEAIQSGANLLLTFKNVRNEVGKGSAIFDRATKAAVDLSAAGFGDLTGTTKQLGKALNDPIKGISALGRAGVTFTEAQKEQIKTLVESNKTLDAQKIILREVESQVGGSAAAQVTASDKAAVAIGNLKEQIGTALLPVVDDLANKVADDIVPAVSEFITGMQDGTGAGGDFADILRDVVDFGEGVVDFLKAIPSDVLKFGAALAVGGYGMSKLRGGIDATVTGLANFRTSAAGAETAGVRLGAAARNLAGAGGLLLLQQGLTNSNREVGALMTTLGGAAAGLAVGGPVGAGIGAGIGAFIGLKNAISGTNDARMPTPKQLGLSDIIAGLDEANAKATEFTHNELFKFLKDKDSSAPLGMSSGPTILATAQAYGIPDRQLVKAMAGDVAAFEAVKKRFRDAVANDPGNDLIKLDRKNILGNIRTSTQAYREERREILHNIAVNKDYGDSLNALPPKKKIQVEATGIIPTVRGIADVAAQIKATPEEINTLIKASGVPTTVAAVQKVIDRSKELGRQKPKVPVDADTSKATSKSKTLQKYINSLTGSVRVGADTSSALAAIQSVINRNWSTFVSVIPFGPEGRATGGPVVAGQPYIVGERRPELFIPDQNGRIIPSVPSPTELATGAASSSVDLEQASYRAFSRALNDSGTIIMSKDNLEALDILVGAG